MMMRLLATPVLLFLLTTMFLCGCEKNPVPGTAKSASPRFFAIAPQFSAAREFKEGLAAVQIGKKENGKWGFIDKTGKVLIQPEFDSAEVFSDGLCAVLVGGNHGKWGFIDKHGMFMINPQFFMVWEPGFINGLARVDVGDFSTADSATIIDRKGDHLLPPTFDFIGVFQEGLAVGGHWGLGGSYQKGVEYIDTQGKRAFLQKLVNGGNFTDGLAPAAIKDAKNLQKWGFINKQGVFVISPQYDFADGFREGYAEVGMGDLQSLENGTARFGFIDTKGTVVIPLQFSTAFDFSEGLAAIRIGDEKTGRWGLIGKDGSYIVNPKFSSLSSFKDGLAAASINGKKYGFIDKSGNFVIAPAYDGAGDVADRYASVDFKEGDHWKWGVIDTKGNYVVQPISEEEIVFSDGMAAVKVNGEYGYLKKPRS
jgi:hypothetical protein